MTRINRLVGPLCLLGAGAFAQTTVVTGTITDPQGDLLQGSCSIQAVAPFTASAGWRVVGAPMVVSFQGGSFAATLAPTDSASPSGQYYKVNCIVPVQTFGGRLVGPYSWGPRYWLVPTSVTPLDISQIEVTSPPPQPSWTILPQQISGGTLTPGVNCFNVNSAGYISSLALCTTLLAPLFQPTITTGTTTQYLRGDLSLATFPTTWPWAGITEVPSIANTVFGRTGTVTAQNGDYTSDQVTEGSANLYFTAARAQAGMSGLYQTPITTGTAAQYFRGDLSLATFPTTWAWNNLTGVPTLTNTVFGRSGTVTAQAGDYTSDQVNEGVSHLYFTNARAQAALAGLYQTPITTGSTAQYFRGDLSLATFPTTMAWANLTGIPTLTNTVFGRSGTVTAQAGDYSTAQVTESGNLYFTNARAQSAMAGLYQAPISGAPGTWPTTWAWSALSGVPSSFNAGQILTATIPALATGHLYYNGTTLAWDPATYLTANQSISITGPCAGSGAVSISLTCTIPWANVLGALSAANTWTAAQAFSGGFMVGTWATFTSNAANSMFAGGGGGLNTAMYNTAYGQSTLEIASTGGSNTAFGAQALYSVTTGSSNTAVGYGALYENNGYDNVAMGVAAGNYYTGTNWDTGVSQSIFIGMGTTALGNTDTNEIVIGYHAAGAGTNTAVLGNSSVTDVYDGGAAGAANHHENGQFLTSRYSAAGSTIPACNATTLLEEVAVTDATSGTPGTTYASGGTWTVPVRCKYNSSGSSYVWMVE